eukprot:Pgem_evm1s3279
MAYLKQHKKDKRGIIAKVFANLKMSRYMIALSGNKLINDSNGFYFKQFPQESFIGIRSHSLLKTWAEEFRENVDIQGLRFLAGMIVECAYMALRIPLNNDTKLSSLLGCKAPFPSKTLLAKDLMPS